ETAKYSISDGGAMSLHRSQHGIPHFRDGFRPVDLSQNMPLAVVIDHWRGLLEVHLEAPLSRFDGVVFALVKLTATTIAAAGRRRWIEDLVVGRLTLPAQPASRQAADELVTGDGEVDRLVDL